MFLQLNANWELKKRLRHHSFYSHQHSRQQIERVNVQYWNCASFRFFPSLAIVCLPDRGGWLFPSAGLPYATCLLTDSEVDAGTHEASALLLLRKKTHGSSYASPVKGEERAFEVSVVLLSPALFDHIIAFAGFLAGCVQLKKLGKLQTFSFKKGFSPYAWDSVYSLTSVTCWRIMCGSNCVCKSKHRAGDMLSSLFVKVCLW